MPLSDVKHVFVLMLENRSFDHMLGAIPLKGVGPDGTVTVADVAAPGSFVNADAQNNSYSNTTPAPLVMPSDPPHEYDDVVLQLLGANNDPPNNYNNIPINNSGFIKSYAPAAKGPHGDVLTSFLQGQVPCLAQLAQEYCVCDRWFSSLPGPTIPNRFFLCAATSNGNPKSPPALGVADAQFVDSYAFANGDIFKRIKQATSLKFRIYRGDSLPFASLLEGVDYDADTVPYDAAAFAADCNGPALPDFIFIEPSYGIFTGYQYGTSQHPRADVSLGDRLIGEVYNSISRSACWASSVLIIIYDEHGGFFDHVTPPKAVAPGDVQDVYDFHFTQLGVRVPAVIVSPLLVQRALIDHTVYDHTSVLATLRAVFPEIGSFTQRDLAASTLSHLFDGAPANAAPLQLAPFAPVPAAAVAPGAPMADDTEPMEHAEISGLRIAAGIRYRVGKVPRKTVLAEISGIKTKGQARAYMRDVDAMIRARDAGPRISPGPKASKTRPGAKPGRSPAKRTRIPNGEQGTG